MGENTAMHTVHKMSRPHIFTQHSQMPKIIGGSTPEIILPTLFHLFDPSYHPLLQVGSLTEDFTNSLSGFRPWEEEICVQIQQNKEGCNKCHMGNEFLRRLKNEEVALAGVAQWIEHGPAN